jgi:hypothetical protein
MAALKTAASFIQDLKGLDIQTTVNEVFQRGEMLALLDFNQTQMGLNIFKMENTMAKFDGNDQFPNAVKVVSFLLSELTAAGMQISGEGLKANGNNVEGGPMTFSIQATTALRDKVITIAKQMIPQRFLQQFDPDGCIMNFFSQIQPFQINAKAVYVQLQPNAVELRAQLNAYLPWTDMKSTYVPIAANLITTCKNNRILGMVMSLPGVDADKNGSLTADEILNNSMVKQFLQPDATKFNGEEGFSFGVAATVVKAKIGAGQAAGQ